jgi:hypothetical protein
MSSTSIKRIIAATIHIQIDIVKSAGFYHFIYQ